MQFKKIPIKARIDMFILGCKLAQLFIIFIPFNINDHLAMGVVLMQILVKKDLMHSLHC
jgi:hypothetical protein